MRHGPAPRATPRRTGVTTSCSRPERAHALHDGDQPRGLLGVAGADVVLGQPDGPGNDERRHVNGAVLTGITPRRHGTADRPSPYAERDGGRGHAGLGRRSPRPGGRRAPPLVRVERPVPEPGPGEVRVRVSAPAGCAGRISTSTEGDLVPRRPRVTPGHEVVGVVDRLGPGSTRWQRGRPHRRALAGAHLRGLSFLCLWPREPVL